MLIAILIFLASIIGLLFSSSISLDSAEKVGKNLGLSDLIIGVVFIGFGTSLPELLVSHMASLEGKSLISLGNILGSNISNTTLILGIACLLTPVAVNQAAQLKQSIMLFIATLLITANYFFLNDFTPLIGTVLLIGFIGYLWKSLGDDSDKSDRRVSINYPKEISILVLGFVIMFFSGKYLISSISEIGGLLGFSEYVIAAIALALGTSAPELFTALVAIGKKKDINLIFGNIIGSNLFNILLVLGTTSFYTIKLPKAAFSFDFLVLSILSVWLLGKCLLKKDLKKVSGIFLLVVYGVCIQYWLTSQY